VSKKNFQSFETLFNEQKYDAAFTSLEKLRESLEPSVFHYNMSLVTRKLGNLVDARLHVEKAIDFGLSTPETTQILDELKNELNLTTLEEKTSLNDYIYHNSLILNQEYLLAISLLILLSVVLIFKRFNKNLLIGLVVFIISISSGVMFVTFNKEKIIMIEDSKVFIGPSKILEVVGVIPKGLKLIVQEDNNSKWIKVVAPYKLQGWIEKKGFKKL
jgi:hypothetical protein